jgi:ABC-2 type transport system ATP-binding protein
MDTIVNPATAASEQHDAARAAIAVERLVKRYHDVIAVDGISFTVPQGSFTALLGGNGAGKTTTIAMMLGLVLPTAGKITILGQDFATHAKSLLARMNFQSPYADLPRRLTVRQNLTIYAHLYGVGPVKDRIAYLARELDLEALLDRPLGELSAGQRTRAGLAKAFINQPRVVLLDEPTASLDPRSQSRLLDFIGELGKEGKTIITATHDLDIVEEIADRVVMFCEEHEITGEGAPHEVLSDYDRLVECNLIHEHRHRHDGAEHVHHHLHPAVHEHEH